MIFNVVKLRTHWELGKLGLTQQGNYFKLYWNIMIL